VVVIGRGKRASRIRILRGWVVKELRAQSIAPKWEGMGLVFPPDSARVTRLMVPGKVETALQAHMAPGWVVIMLRAMSVPRWVGTVVSTETLALRRSSLCRGGMSVLVLMNPAIKGTYLDWP
jgi:hypothetical protein